MQKNPDSRTYQLYIIVEKPVAITIGKLGTFSFPAGQYVYTGSGGKNIESRVARHLSGAKKLRWHIDYLLACPGVRIIGFTLSGENECALNQSTEGKIPVPRFGSTDCRNGCGSHLKFLRDLQRSDLNEE